MGNIKHYPLTSPQLSIWYTEKMYPGTSISNVAGSLRIKDKLDFDLLGKAINLFIKNNEGIRLRICLDDYGNPLQYVSDYDYKEIELKDFSHCDDPTKAMYEWDGREILTPLKMLNCDLYHFAMLKLSDTEGGFFVNTHHIISDAWSMSIIGSSVIRYYFYLKNSNTDAINQAIMPSYLSFVENEQLYKESNRFLKDKIFWEEKFNLPPEATVLKPRTTNIKSTQSKRKTYVAPKKFTHLLRTYCSDNKLSPYPLFLSALAMYINRVSAKENMIIGTPILNRLNQAEKNTLGMFISTIPLGINVKSEDSFSSLTQEISELCSSSYRHQRYPYDAILGFVRETYGFTDNLYDIVLSYQNSKFEKPADIDYSTRWHFNGHQSNSLTIHINDRDDDGVLIIDYDYHTDLYFDKEIEFLHQHLLSLLWHSLDNPNNKICKIEMLTESEKKKLLYGFNDTAMDYPREKLIHQLFEEQVKRTPDRLAIKFEDKVMTYSELNNKSNQLAHILRRKGVVADQIVGIMAHRSLELMVGILAVLKSGGAFMPIEPDYPTERIKYMLEESNTGIVLASKDLFRDDFNAEFIDIFDELIYQDQSTEDLDLINQSNHLVYVIFTSGSTGLPKGVMIEHKSLHNFLCGMKDFFSYDETTVILSVASICFDLFILETIPALIHGSELIIANKDEEKIPFLLSELIIKNNVKVILFTPSRLKLLIQDKKNSSCLKNVQQIMVGGEELEPHLFSKIKEITDAKIINGYGPTEITIAATFKDLTQSNKITIGKPIRNTKIYILDSFFNPVPIGTQGEIYITGEGLARGYLNNENLTKQVFISNPFEKSERLYKTGDIARWYPGGDIGFIGRKDKQVKLRGYRIELGEIENTILRYHGVKDVAVVIRNNDNHGDFIYAYFVSDKKININEIKVYLSSQLPRYMIPNYMMQIKAMPISSNGKKDLGKLPEININRNFGKKIVPPSSRVQTVLWNILCKLLKIDQFDVEEDIFSYGADSLTVIQLISLLDKEGYNVSINDVYKNPTIKKLSDIIEDRIKKEIVHNKNVKGIHFDNSAAKSLYRRVMCGDLPKIDSAALSYIPDNVGILPIDDNPILYNYIKTSLGNVGVFALPIVGIDLYRENERLLNLCSKAIQQAESIGAKVVSLTGLIPSATHYGHDIVEKVETDVKITTGHATTAAAVILSLERLLSESNRDIQNEDVLILGMGSVGTTVTELLTSLYPKIKKITLCDRYQKRDYLENVKQNLQKHFDGKINILYSGTEKALKKFYDATLIIGATNAPDIIDINLLKPGTLIIDDSGPHCFSKAKAISRLTENSDILFTEGGVIHSNSPMKKYIYLPEYINESITNDFYQHFISKHEITGCILSSLLTVKFKELSPTIGAISCKESLKHYQILKNHDYKGAILHCDDFIIPQPKIESFRKLFGKVLCK